MSNAIPTEYAGIRFRSRLEAQWAAFFDLLGWPWQYEPFDLAGYIPDFTIRRKSAPGAKVAFTDVLFEAKPETSLPGLTKHGGKIIASGWKGDFVVIGAGPLVDDFGVPCLGKEFVWDPTISGFIEADVNNIGVDFFGCAHCNRIVFDSWGCHNCCLCGEHSLSPNPLLDRYSGDHGVRTAVDTGLIRSLWLTAKNRMQWKGEFGG